MITGMLRRSPTSVIVWRCYRTRRPLPAVAASHLPPGTRLALPVAPCPPQPTPSNPLVYNPHRAFLSKADKLRLIKSGAVKSKFSRGSSSPFIDESDAKSTNNDSKSDVSADAVSVAATEANSTASGSSSDSPLSKDQAESNKELPPSETTASSDSTTPEDTVDHSSSKPPTPETTPPPPTLATGRPRVEWFSDSHLLSKRIHEVMQKEEGITYAEQLVSRHPGSTNEGVYGALIGGYVRNKMYEKAMETYNVMKKRKMNPTPATITSLINLYTELSYKIPKSDKSALKSRLLDVLKLWEKLDTKTRTVVHCNAVLSACVPAAHCGGFEVAKSIYETLLEDSQQEVKQKKYGNDGKGKKSTKEKAVKAEESDLENEHVEPLKPDIQTFTSMIRVCANSMEGNEAYHYAMKIWDSDVPSLKITPDEHLVDATLFACLSAKSSPLTARAISIARSAYSLPTPNTERGFLYTDEPGKALSKLAKPFNSTSSKLKLSPRTLDVLLRLAAKLRQRPLGIQYMDVALERGVKLDLGLLDGCLYSLIPAGQHEKAWEIVESLEASLANEGQTSRGAYQTNYAINRIDELKFRVCGAAVSNRFQDSKAMVNAHNIWIPRGLDLLAKILDKHSPLSTPTPSLSQLPVVKFPPQSVGHILQILNNRTRAKPILGAHFVTSITPTVQSIILKIKEEAQKTLAPSSPEPLNETDTASTPKRERDPLRSRRWKELEARIRILKLCESTLFQAIELVENHGTPSARPRSKPTPKKSEDDDGQQSWRIRFEELNDPVGLSPEIFGGWISTMDQISATIRLWEGLKSGEASWEMVDEVKEEYNLAVPVKRRHRKTESGREEKGRREYSDEGYRKV
ncbi:hypothetical protein HDV05_005816 [Chytridiales sp. JEL 0842]|nr:hypothetical protein HDV05_005816 [Chytridiales sp. JEL 0842]